MDAQPPRTLSFPWDNPPETGEAIEVAGGVLWLRLPLPMKLDHVNVYALDDGDGWTLVDTGFDTHKTRDIWAGLLAGPLKGKPVRRVVATHHHPDHIGLAGWFQTDFGAELVTSRTSWLFARMLTLDVQEVMPPETEAYYRSAGMDPELLAQRKAERPFNFANVVAPLPLGYTRVKEGDTIRMGGRRWAVHMGDGHAPEHATFWSLDDDLVLTGDQILSSISPNIGVHATEPLADPLAEWLAACERLSVLARPGQLALGGHKMPFVGLPLRMAQLIQNHHSALKRLVKHLEQPHSAAECFPPLFKRTIGPGEYGLALVEAVSHVNHLYLSGQVSRSRRDDGAWVYQALV